ncbi:hypothetical protein GGS23DRAFT_283146 [Durotheca rogersii]|uniref:uncharacterized protein n=1 Tax=Durotheca rogersii TaxID=419775 RepID=UPI00221EA03D|nr:uncharacterized protein GGS23DRAFT_283146 [Durotheca rogersii]KAI5866685.1 hypothetical protein GGS23DRAFT_283146 [Durotheca rogersii]
MSRFPSPIKHRYDVRAIPSGPYPRPMERIESNRLRQKTRWWLSSVGEPRTKDGWAETPRDTPWTTGSHINSKPKPSSYDSGSLVTIIRSSQCLAAILALVLYVFTMSGPTLWLLVLASATSVLSGGWCILALFLRHVWSVWLVIPELLLALTWVVLFVVSSTTTPDDSKALTFRLGMMAIEAAMVLWTQTSLLAITPVFHQTISCLFGARSRGDPGNGPLMQGAPGMVRCFAQ